jgi:hypothetical protein
VTVPSPGVRLRLLIGPTVPQAASYAQMEALQSVEVQASERGRDSFQLTFSLGKRPLDDYGLLRGKALDPPARVAIVITVGSLAETVLDGVVSRHELVPSGEPGQSTLVVSGEDLTNLLDRTQERRPHSQQSDSKIVERILDEYGFEPDVEQTSERPTDSRRIPRQTVTDLRYVQDLADHNGFVFYLEATRRLGRPLAYWGPADRDGPPQPPLNAEMGSLTNVHQLRFGFDALAAATPKLAIIDPDSKAVVPVAAPDRPEPGLSSSPARPLRTRQLGDVAGLDSVQAALRALSFGSRSADPVDGSGVLEVGSYGRLLRRGRRVEVRGAGKTNNGAYYVTAVTHTIRRGSYQQRFQLRREGRGATSTQVGKG